MKRNEENSYELIYEIVRAIPRGRATSYGAIAAALGMKSGARLVGYAMNSCSKYDPQIPAHRVVNRNGLLTGRHHFSPQERMEQLLRAEGIDVKENAIVNFKSIFWDPQTELL